MTVWNHLDFKIDCQKVSTQIMVEFDGSIDHWY